MPVAVDDTKSRIILVRAFGQVTLAEVRDLFTQLRAEADVARGIGILCDAQGVTGVPSTTELRIIASEIVPLYTEGLRGVAVVTERTFVYGVSRMFASIAELLGATVAVFRDDASARVWLEPLVADAG